MEMLLVIASNDKCWDRDEWDALSNRALEIHLHIQKSAYSI